MIDENVTKEEMQKVLDKEGDYSAWNKFGYKCEIKRNHFLCWCGYVYIPKDIELKNIYDIEVHGGVTYDEIKNDNRILGFDTSHSGDLYPCYAINDTLNNFKHGTYKDKVYAITQTNQMLNELIKYNPQLIFPNDK